MQPIGASGSGAANFRTESGGYGTVWKSGTAKTVEEVPLYKELVSLNSISLKMLLLLKFFIY